MAKRTIEFKLEPEWGERWEDAPVMATLKFTSDADAPSGVAVMVANRVATAIAENAKAQVRWNFKGSLQGHYMGRPFRKRSTMIVKVS